MVVAKVGIKTYIFNLISSTFIIVVGIVKKEGNEIKGRFNASIKKKCSEILLIHNHKDDVKSCCRNVRYS